MNWRSISRRFIDNGSATNVMPIRMVQALGKTEEDLLSLKVTVVAFIIDMTKALGVLLMEITMGTKATTFFVVAFTANY